jgi:hypothetical protein
LSARAMQAERKIAAVIVSKNLDFISGYREIS